MNAHQTQSMYLCIFVMFIATCVATVQNEELNQNKEDSKIELFDGVYMGFPRENNTGRLFSIEVDTNKSLSEGRGKKKKLMNRILPIFVMPFILQSAMTPFILGLLKFMLLKAFLVGKLALTLIMFNAFRNHNSFKGRDTELASENYGYHGHNLEHYTSLLNR